MSRLGDELTMRRVDWHLTTGRKVLGRAIGLGSEWDGELTNQGAKFQGANWSRSYWPIRSRERIGPRANIVATVPSIPDQSRAHTRI